MSFIEQLNALEPTRVAFVCCVILSTLAAITLSRNMRRSKPAGTVVLQDPSKRYSLPLVDKLHVSEHVRRFRFGLESGGHILGLPIGKHITLSATISNPRDSREPPKYVARQYTPISSDYTGGGYVDLLVKVYRKNEHPSFPDGGWMTQYLDSLSLGSLVDVKGPSGRVEYLEHGRFQIGRSVLKCSQVAMIAGGTGITPMYQLIQHVLETRKGSDHLSLSLLYGNQHPGDILLREELGSFAESHPSQFKLTYTVDRLEKDEKWTGFFGFVTKEMILASLPAPSDDLIVLLCGSPPMVNLLENLLLNLGYPKLRIHAF